MTQPSNPLIRIAEQDTTLPVAGGTNKIEPVDLLKTVGFDKGNKAFAQNMNYIFDNLADWIAYSQERLDNLETQIEKERVSVGEIIEISGDATNPSVLKGYGTWESFGEGQTLIGVGTHTDDRSESKTWIDGQSEGEYRHVQIESEMARHAHSATTEDDTHRHDYSKLDSFGGIAAGSFGDLPYSKGLPDVGSSGYGVTGGSDGSGVSIEMTHVSYETLPYTHNHPVTVNNNGDSTPMNNVQPTLAVYRWKRTA